MSNYSLANILYIY